MGISITPTGLLTALAVAAVPLLIVANWGTLKALLPRLPSSQSDDEAATSEDRPADGGPHVLDVMKTLTEVNQRLQLGCEDELCAIYAKIVASTAPAMPAEKP